MLFYLTQEEIAREIGKSRGYVVERLSLLDLPGEIKNAARAAHLDISSLRQVASLDNSQDQI